MEKVTLEQQAKTGKTKVLEIWTDNNIIHRRWGLQGHKFQTAERVCEGKNIGKANEVTPEMQAELEAQRIIVKKIREGYFDQGGEQSKVVTNNFFNSLPTNLAFSKPITDPPADLEEVMEDYCAERKNNGVNLLRVVDDSGVNHTYSRGIREITTVTKDITPIQEFNNGVELPNRTIVSYEFIHYNRDDRETPKDLRGILNDKTSPEKSLARYSKLIREGSTFAIKVFDILFLNGVDVSNEEYYVRRGFLEEYVFDYSVDDEYKSPYAKVVTPHIIQTAKDFDWEGLILRKLRGPLSTVEYTMNGKPSRKGAWKLVFTKTSDFFITEIRIGTSGRLKGLPAKFHLYQYNTEKEIIDCGWAGPGKVKTEDLIELQNEWGLSEAEPGKVHSIPAALTPIVEIVFRNRQLDTDSLEFPVIQRFRNDKPVKECLMEDR